MLTFFRYFQRILFLLDRSVLYSLTLLKLHPHCICKHKRLLTRVCNRLRVTSWELLHIWHVSNNGNLSRWPYMHFTILYLLIYVNVHLLGEKRTFSADSTWTVLTGHLRSTEVKNIVTLGKGDNSAGRWKRYIYNSMVQLLLKGKLLSDQLITCYKLYLHDKIVFSWIIFIAELFSYAINDEMSTTSLLLSAKSVPFRPI